MKRRGNREGSIFRRKDGLWIGQLYFGLDTRGRKRYVRFYGRTQAAAMEKLTAARHDRQRGMLADPTQETVGQFLERWLADVVLLSTRHATFVSYGQHLRQHVIPAIGSVRLTKLSPVHVQRMQARALESGHSSRCVRYSHDLLRHALDQALKWGLVPRNVTDAVERPCVQRREMRVLNPPQAASLLERAREDRLHALYVLGVTTGMRQGELLGLTWDAVDLEQGRLQVVRQLERVRAAGDEPRLVEPKTRRSRRAIELSVGCVRALREHRARQLQERLALGEAWQDRWGLVFTTEIGTPLQPSNVVRRSFLPLLARAGLPRIRFHDLRHTAATLLLAAGEHPKVVQELLGHHSVAFTLDAYSHVLQSMQKAAAARMDSILDMASGDH